MKHDEKPNRRRKKNKKNERGIELAASNRERRRKNAPLSSFFPLSRRLRHRLRLHGTAEDTESSPPSGVGVAERALRARERETSEEKENQPSTTTTASLFAIASSLTLSPPPPPPTSYPLIAPPLRAPQRALLDHQLRSARVEQQQLVDGRRARYEFFCLQALQGDASAAIGLRSSPSFARSWSPKDLGPEQRAREGGDKLTLCGEKRVPRTVASERESGERRSIQNKEAAAGGVR